jgi:hypothetical protein
VVEPTTAAYAVSGKRVDRRHVERIARRAVATRLRGCGPYPNPFLAVESRPDGVFLHLNSGGNALAVESALIDRGYRVVEADAPRAYGVGLLVPRLQTAQKPEGGA